MGKNRQFQYHGPLNFVQILNPIEDMHKNSDLLLPDHSQGKYGYVTQETETR